jgi:hypothetical protein
MKNVRWLRALAASAFLAGLCLLFVTPGFGLVIAAIAAWAAAFVKSF